MKTLSQFVNENVCTTADVNPGNGLGVTNRYTPIMNIVTNVRNLFATRLGIVASVAEDGISLKLNSSYFNTKENVNKVLSNPISNGTTSVRQFIISQGLDVEKYINVGQFWVVYFSPGDVKMADDQVCPVCKCNPCICADHDQENLATGKTIEPDPCPVKEMLSPVIASEIEMESIITEDDDEGLKDLTHEELIKLVESKDKVKAAKQFETIIAQQMELPKEYYFAGVKDKDGTESIALRWKYLKKRPHGKTTETVRSLFNIYGTGKEAIWIQDFVEDSLFHLPDEVKKLIENILELLDAKKTSHPELWSLEGSEKSDKDEDKDKDKDKDKDEDKDKDKDKDTDKTEDTDKDKDKDKDSDTDSLL